MSVSKISGLEALEDLVIVPPKFGFGKMGPKGVRGNLDTGVLGEVRSTMNAGAHHFLHTAGGRGLIDLHCAVQQIIRFIILGLVVGVSVRLHG